MNVMEIIMLVLGSAVLLGAIGFIIYFATLKPNTFINLDTGEVKECRNIFEAIAYFEVNPKRVITLKEFVEKYEMPYLERE
jgi:hypothetical protein